MQSLLKTDLKFLLRKTPARLNLKIDLISLHPYPVFTAIFKPVLFNKTLGANVIEITLVLYKLLWSVLLKTIF